MPDRLSAVFDRAKTDPIDRHKKIRSFEYQGSILEAAEVVEILPGGKKVEDQEDLARIMESPSHVDPETGLFKTIAFDEATRRGLSVQRDSMTTPDTIHLAGNSKVNTHNGKEGVTKRAYVGYVLSACSAFREAISPEPNGRRLFGVFSTPEDGELSHADVFVVVKPTPIEKLAIQRVFHEAFNLSKLIPNPSL
ncbi:hypothetical protein [Pseudomonas fulva]|uniref:hypothetical protein n=1 Tax=Pseudomonas fulva TaxID=47880 RepID=UPI0015E456C3|nr:hypothetical protein [Pseudomonas fulva]MBA1209812.1 hypothetical protein [Pseudomonas fulva]